MTLYILAGKWFSETSECYEKQLNSNCNYLFCAAIIEIISQYPCTVVLQHCHFLEWPPAYVGMFRVCGHGVTRVPWVCYTVARGVAWCKVEIWGRGQPVACASNPGWAAPLSYGATRQDTPTRPMLSVAL